MTGLWAERAEGTSVALAVTDPEQGKEAQPSGEPPLAALPEDAAGRGLGPDR